MKNAIANPVRSYWLGTVCSNLDFTICLKKTLKTPRVKSNSIFGNCKWQPMAIFKIQLDYRSWKSIIWTIFEPIYFEFCSNFSDFGTPYCRVWHSYMKVLQKSTYSSVAYEMTPYSAITCKKLMRTTHIKLHPTPSSF